MGYYVSHMIGIRTGGVFSGKTNIDTMKSRIAKIIAEMRGGDSNPDIGDDPSHCMSQELEAHKGSYVVLAGVFNYWGFDSASEFVRRLSQEFGVEILHMCWDESQNKVRCQIWLNGNPLLAERATPASPVTDIQRRPLTLRVRGGHASYLEDL